MENYKYSVKKLITIPLSNAPLSAGIIALNNVINGLLPNIKIIVISIFIDTAISISNGVKSINDSIMCIVLLMLILIYQGVSEELNKAFRIKMENKLRVNFRFVIIKKIVSLKYEYIENSKILDLISRISQSPEKQCSVAFLQTLDLISMIIRICGILLILFFKSWWSVIFILGISIPLLKISLMAGKANYIANKKAEKYNRRVEYLKKVLTDRESAEERNLFGYSNYINKIWEQNYEISRKMTFKVRLKWFIHSKLGSSITTILTITILLILIILLKNGVVSLGLFIAIEGAVYNLIQELAWNLPYYGQELAANKEYLKDLGVLMELEESLQPDKKILKKDNKLRTLEFKSVSFKYPDSETYILKNMSFYIQAGKHYSFVGVNGAGKSTIIKLITGLYDNFEGDILINGISIREFTQEDLGRICSVVYQDFARYYISLYDNICLGLSNVEINNIIEKVGLDKVVEKLPSGIDTNLGKIDDEGVDLSGGEWQRVAMARSLVRDASLTILDEPTAALDPISESNVYRMFEDLSKDKTTIFISHRLASTKLADEIFVIGEGRVLEKGSFSELMNINMVYANMYNSQRSWYIED